MPDPGLKLKAVAVLGVQLLPTSVGHAKLPESRRRARNFSLPPRTRSLRTATLEESLVIAGWRPISYLGAQECTGRARWEGQTCTHALGHPRQQLKNKKAG